MLSKIQNFTVLELLGKGGMGDVYLAKDNLERKFAIKVFSASYSNDKELAQRFYQEAKTLSALKHPNIVELHSFFEENEGLFIVMEYVEGITLKEMITKNTGPIPEVRARKILLKILNALSYAHSKGIIHRDIKPSNIMIGEDDSVKILDFGIAKILGDGFQTSKTGTKMGTLYYMSPEQIQTPRDIDLRTDIYSLGITFYEMMTGKVPFDTKTESEYKIMGQIVDGTITDPRNIYPGISQSAVEILKKMVEKDRQNRFSDCGECIALLDEVKPAPPNIPEMETKTKKKRTAAYIFIIAALLVTLSIGLFSYYASHHVQDPQLAAHYEKYGDGCNEKGNWKKAIEMYMYASAYNENNITSLIKAGDAYRVGLSDYRKAIECYKKAIEVDDKSFESYKSCGMTYYYINEYNQAIEMLNKAANLKPKDYLVHNLLGMSFYEKGNFDSAINEYNKVIDIDPKNTDALYNVSMVYFRKGSVRKAIEFVEKGIAIDPNVSQSYSNLAYYQMELGNYDAAYNNFMKAGKLNDKNFDASLGLTLLWYETGKYSSVKRGLRYSCYLDPVLKEGMNGIEKLENRGMYFSNKNKETLKKVFNEYLKTVDVVEESEDKSKEESVSEKQTLRNKVSDLYKKGNNYFKRGDYEAAIIAYKEIIRIAPKESIPYYNVGYIYGKQNKFDSQVAYYKKAARLGEKDSQRWLTDNGISW